MKSHQETQTEAVKLLGSDDPFKVFETWLTQAKAHSGIREPLAMTLSTAVKDQPSSRVVLLKEIKDKGFIFYTNYQSEKGKQLKLNPKAALNFYWDPLALQCRIQGLIHAVDRATSEAYWNSRARGSQISQWISHQSEIAESREQLQGLVQKAEEKFKGVPVPCPEHWGGYILHPENLEFWIGLESRLHDRFVFKKQDHDWLSLRLFP